MVKENTTYLVNILPSTIIRYNSTSFVIKGNPIALARARIGNGKFYDSQVSYKITLQGQLEKQIPIDYNLFTGPILLDITFYMKKPTRTKAGTWAYKRPDLSNLIKLIEDVGNGLLYTDDAIIVMIIARKIYDTTPRTEFTLSSI